MCRSLVQLTSAVGGQGAPDEMVHQMRDIRESADEDDFNLEELVRDIIGDVDFPIVMNVAYGHNDRKMAIPLGARGKLDGKEGSLTLL